MLGDSQANSTAALVGLKYTEGNVVSPSGGVSPPGPKQSGSAERSLSEGPLIYLIGGPFGY